MIFLLIFSVGVTTVVSANILDFEADCIESGFGESYCTEITDFVIDGRGCDASGFTVYEEVPGCFVIPDGAGGGRYCSPSTNELIAFTDADDYVTKLYEDESLFVIGTSRGPDEILCEPLVETILGEDFDDGLNPPFFIDADYTVEEVTPDESDCSDGTSRGVWGSAEGEAVRPSDGSGGFVLNIDISGQITECVSNVDGGIGLEFRFAGEGRPFTSEEVSVNSSGVFNESITYQVPQAKAETLQITSGQIGVNVEAVESGLTLGNPNDNNTRGILLNIVDESSADEDTDIEDSPDRPENAPETTTREDEESTENSSTSANGIEACINTGGAVSAENVQACIRCVENGGIYIAIGCVDPTPLGITTRLIQIALGTMGGVALIQMIVAGIQYQSGEEEKIAEARQKILTTIGGIALLIFSVLILQIIGVDILDILPSGSV